MTVKERITALRARMKETGIDADGIIGKIIDRKAQ